MFIPYTTHLLHCMGWFIIGFATLVVSSWWMMKTSFILGAGAVCQHQLYASVLLWACPYWLFRGPTSYWKFDAVDFWGSGVVTRVVSVWAKCVWFEPLAFLLGSFTAWRAPSYMSARVCTRPLRLCFVPVVWQSAHSAWQEAEGRTPAHRWGCTLLSFKPYMLDNSKFFVQICMQSFSGDSIHFISQKCTESKLDSYMSRHCSNMSQTSSKNLP